MNIEKEFLKLMKTRDNEILEMLIEYLRNIISTFELTNKMTKETQYKILVMNYMLTKIIEFKNVHLKNIDNRIKK